MRYISDVRSHGRLHCLYPTPDELALLEKNLNLLPASYRRVLDDRLVAICFIDNFKGSGMTDYVLDADKKVYATLILSPETTRHDISDWTSYREWTCFMSGPAGDGASR